LTKITVQEVQLLLPLGSPEPFYCRAHNRAKEGTNKVTNNKTSRPSNRGHAYKAAKEETEGEPDHHIPICGPYHTLSVSIPSEIIKSNPGQTRGQCSGTGAGHIIGLASGKSNHRLQPANWTPYRCQLGSGPVQIPGAPRLHSIWWLSGTSKIEFDSRK
jgi:hypothetical protein